MAKKLLQDVIRKNPSFERRDLPVLNTIPKIQNEPRIKEIKNIIDIKDLKDNSDLNLEKKENNSTGSIWILAFVALCFLFFGFFSLFNKATIVINPKIQNVNFDQKLIFYKKGEGVGFDVGMMSGEELKNITTGKTEYVEKKAQSIVTIFNENTNSQNFASSTRLLGSNGKIYKTKKEVVVPELKESDDGEKIPGLIDVEIEAENFGEEYNSIPIDFEIVSLKGTSKASRFKVLSKGEITGGFKGETLAITEEQKTKILNEMQESLKNRLFLQIKNQIPETSIVFDNSLVFKIDKEDLILSEDKDFFTFSLKGTVYAVLFDRDKLSQEIANRSIEKLNEEELVYLNNLDSFKFEYSSSFDTQNIFDATVLNFDLSGDAEIVWKVDEQKILQSLLYRNKKDFNNLMNNFSSIASAELSLRPPWNKYLPKDLKDFDLKVIYPDK